MPPSPGHALDERHVVALEQDLLHPQSAIVPRPVLLRWRHTPNGLLVSVLFVLEICLTSIASSIYGAGSAWFALRTARHATHNQVHELVEPLGTLSAPWHPNDSRASYPDGANDADRQLLVEPDLDRRALLQEPEEEVDWGQQNPATATTSASHCVVDGCLSGKAMRFVVRVVVELLAVLLVVAACRA